ncbi:MAG: LysR family transcriptional regulator [Rhodobacteraceae bacterium]|nr:LysR family transcriptional regulator [Paracoccaceae bacterium]
MAVKLEMLRVFRVVAEQGHLTGAASVLGRTPSAVSMMLAQLEDHIGAPLFETDRKNRLTPLGQLVLEESSRATDAFARSVDAIGRHAMSTAGTVRIAAVPSATVTLLPGIITAYRRLRPEVRLEISDVDSAAVRRRVMLDEADIGILSAAVGEPADGEVILEDDLGILCRSAGPIDARLAEGMECQWDLLRLEPLIANPLCQLVDNPCIAALLAACNLEARNTTALMSFVRNGLGATILPSSAILDQPEGLAFHAPKDPQTRRQLRKMRRDQSHFSPAVSAFWSALRAVD